MKALTRYKYGTTKVLEFSDLFTPKPNDNEILIKVYATTVNRTDCAILYGNPKLMRISTGLLKPKRKITGTDFAGQIIAVGNKVIEYKVNDRVWGFNDEGLNSHSEYMCINSNANVIKMPKNINYNEIVCCAEGFHYALNFVNKYDINSNTNVLLNGATGAIGSSLLQLLKQLQANITAVCSTENIDLVKSLGANKIVDFKNQDFTKTNTKYDFVLDAVGNSSFSLCKEVLNPNGLYISSELGKNFENIWLSLHTRFLGKKKVIIPIPTNVKKSLKYANYLIENEKFVPLIDRKYLFKNIVDAYEYVEMGMKVGNVIIEY